MDIWYTMYKGVYLLLKGLQELAAHVVAFRNVTEAVSSVQVSGVANGPALCAILWQRTCTGGLRAAQRLAWNTTKSHWVFGTCFKNQSFLCTLFYCFSKGVLFIICLRLTSFTGFEELQSACVSTGTGAIAIWWRPGSWAAHNTKHIHRAHFAKTWQHCPTSTWHQAQSVRIWEASKTGNVNGVVEPKQM